MRAPMLVVHTIAAGGGSICRYDGHRLSVGPESAGARPGPLSYGRPEARELTLTDVNLALGRLLPDEFPFPLDLPRVQGALVALSRALDPGEARFDAQKLAEGFWEIANQSMADAISEVSVKRGYDVRAHALLVFGGAGGQHACALVERLGMQEAIFHPFASVLSAFGMGLAVLGFPCDQFGHQEPGDEAQIKEFCSLNYDVTFPLFAKIEVNGVGAHPLYRWLKGEKTGVFGTEAIKWNFTKFLVDRSGRVVKRFAPADSPDKIDTVVGDVLAKD